ncbi:hypothetical protein KC19_VG138800 [Ceratodon purpureus]|uniref:At4g15545-like C-terminal domain-containing protein n=1 Tax=Ceratodon purpureus TaxID=3225 RepID=A0A8T0HPZ7_CERPU|nr:hypothetical protein KC19_VG138800 [Ceratodon purpureus]
MFIPFLKLKSCLIHATKPLIFHYQSKPESAFELLADTKKLRCINMALNITGASSKKSSSLWKSPLGPLIPRDSSWDRARSPRVDGKEFFRQARNRLSYEQFSEFLTNVKELNAHRQTREMYSLTACHPKDFSCNMHTPPHCGDWATPFT